MIRTSLARRVLGIFCLLCLTAAALAQDREAANEPKSLSRCQLHLSLDERGTASISLSLIYTKTPANLRVEQLAEALEQVFGVPLHQVFHNQSNNAMSVSGKAAEAFPPQEGELQGELDLAPLAELIRPLGVAQIDVTLYHFSKRPGLAELKTFTPRHYHIATADPQPLAFVLTSEPASCDGRTTLLATLLAGLFLGPLGLLFWQRWAALRAAEQDPAAAWYRFWRWLHWVTLGSWLVWLTTGSALEASGLLEQFVTGHEMTLTTLRWLIALLPPWLITVCGNALSREVFARLSQNPPSSGDLLRGFARDLLGGLLPLLLAVVGIFTLIRGDLRTGILWLSAALALRVVCTRLAARRQTRGPHAITVGELRDRIFTLAKQAGVSLQQLYVLPTGKTPQANAFAVRGGTVMITDHLLRQLNRREVDAIAAHELGHLKFHHPNWLLTLFIASLFAPAVIPAFLPEWWQSSLLRHVPLWLIVCLGGIHLMLRRFEYQTDAYAAWLTGDPEALITGLVKLHRLNLMPMQWGQWEESLLTHPSTSLRLEAIARHNGVSRQRLDEIVAHPELVQGEPYPLPADLAKSGLIFNSAFKRRIAGRILWILLAAKVLPPGLVALLVQWTVPEGMYRWIALAGGVVLTVVVLLLLQNYVPLLAYAEVRRRLTAQKKAEGLDPQVAGGVFVGFAPHAMARLYEGYSNWDFGFLYLQGDRLCYEGEQTQFALQRAQVTAVRLGRGYPRWLAVPYVYVSWQDRESGTAGTFNLRAGQVRSLLQMRRANSALEDSLQQWCEQGAAPVDLPAALASLSAPQLGEVTSLPVRAVLRARVLWRLTWLVFVLGSGLSFLCGLSFDPAEGGLAWYVTAVAVAAIVFEVMPHWWQRHSFPALDRKSVPRPEPVESAAAEQSS